MAIGHNAFLTGARFHYRDWFPGVNFDKSFRLLDDSMHVGIQ